MTRTGWMLAGAAVLVLGGPVFGPGIGSGLGLGGGVRPGSAWAQGSSAAGAMAPADAITARKNEMKALQRDLEAIKKVLDAGGSVADLAPQANEMRQLLGTVPAVFPPGSEGGDSKALPAVWSDRAGFERAAANAVAAADKFQQAVASGDTAATAGAFRELGASCGGCHRNYRGR